jgi:predicted transposase YdaD
LASVTGKVREALEATMLSLNLPPSKVIRILEERQKAEAREQGREEGGRKALQRALRTLLRQRFHDLPDWADLRIDAASEDLVQRWLLRLVDATSVEDVLAD